MLFERENEVYQDNLLELLANEGKYVVIREDRILPDAFDTYEEALEAGYDTFGPVPFLVRKIQRSQTIDYLSRDIHAGSERPD